MSQTSCGPVYDRSETRSAAISRADLQPASELLASWIAPDRPNSITLSSSLAGRRPAREAASELVRELDSVMEFGLNRPSRWRLSVLRVACYWCRRQGCSVAYLRSQLLDKVRNDTARRRCYLVPSFSGLVQQTSYWSHVSRVRLTHF